MRQIENLSLYDDIMGNEVCTPVMQIGEGAPHIAMVALQHGWEPIGLDTGLQVMRDAHPTGTVTMVSVASPEAYQDRARLTGQHKDPSSGQQVNMNRVHPGDPNGNTAERSAYTIDQYLQSIDPDLVVDLHSYASQSLPHSIVDPASGELSERIDNWMVDSQVVWYKEYDGETLSEQALTNALSAIWVGREVPAITIELGPLNLPSRAQSRLAQQALTNTLISGGAIKGVIVPQITDDLRGTVWQRSEIIYGGGKSGLLRPLVDIGERITTDQDLADVVIPTGEIVDVVQAPKDGVHFIWHDDYRVLPGSRVGVQLIPYQA